MTRKNIPSIWFILTISYGFIYAQDVKVVMTVPDRVVAGTDLRVEVEVQKAALQGFARFQQELPAGITAIAGQSANADFSFNAQKVNMIWLKLPAGETMKFSFILRPHETLKGTFSLGGRFDYIEEEDRNEIGISPRLITITPSPGVDPGLVVDIRDFRGEVQGTALVVPSFDVACYRQTPYRPDQGNYWLVHLLLSRGSVDKLARLEEQIPEGFTAENIDEKGSIFSFKSAIAKFLWMTLPDDPLLVVTYKLVPQAGKVLPAGAIEGTFTYMAEGSSVSVPVIEQGVDLATATPPELVRIMSSLGQQAQKPEERVSRPVVNQPVTTQPLQGVIFRVQILASRKPVQTGTYFRPYGIREQISSEFHEGWYKYTAGNFTTYREAREYLSRLVNTAKLPEAFVCAYTDGKRIPVGTALDLTNQVWFK